MLAVVPAYGQAKNSLDVRKAKDLPQIALHPDLESLSMECLEELTALPDSIGTLTKLKVLKIDNGNGCSMNPVIPESIGNMQALERLTLYGAQDPSAGERKTSKVLKQRHPLPASMSQLKQLRYLDLGRNSLGEIPDFVKDLPNLEEFRFEYNELKTIPRWMGSMQSLKRLDLGANDLTDLPDFLAQLKNLQSIKLGMNCAITQDSAKVASLKKRFPKVKFDLEEEYDCPPPESHK